MADIADAIAATLEASITPTIHDSLTELSDVYFDIRNSFSRVSKNRGIGKDWKVLMTWSSGVAGGAKYQSPRGPNVVANLDNFNMFANMPGFPGLDETVAPATFQSELSLIEHRGNMYLPHQLFRTDQFDSSVGSVVSLYMKGLTRLIALQEASPFFTDNDTAKELITLTTPAGSAGAHVVNGPDTSTVKIYLDGTNNVGRIHRIEDGMLVDVFNSTGTTKRNLGFTLAIDLKDPLDKISNTGIPSFCLRRVDGGTFQETTALNGAANGIGSTDCNGDVIVIKDSFGLAASSLASFIKTSGNWFGVSTTDHPKFKSYVPGGLSGNLTEMVLTKHIAKAKVACPGIKLDMGITTMGTLLGLIDSIDGYSSGNANAGRFRYDRNGEPLDVEAGVQGFNYRFFGTPVDIRTSELCKKGTLYLGHIKNGGLTRYVPPPIPGAGTNSEFGAEVQFLAPFGGSGGVRGIFKHAHTSGGGTSDFVEAPFLRCWNVLPTTPTWMKLGTFTEVLGDE